MRAKEFLEALFGDAIGPDRQISLFLMPARRTQRFETAALAAAYAEKRADKFDVYYGVGLIGGKPRGRGTIADVNAIGGLFADIDLPCAKRAGKPLPASVEEARTLWTPFGLEPSLLVHSGHGLHPYWFFKEPWVFDSADERAAANRLAKGWHQALKAQAAQRGWLIENLGDIARVLRLPGTINHGDPQAPVEVRVLEYHEERRYNPSDFETFIVEPTEVQTAQSGHITLSADAEPPADKMLSAISECAQFKETWERQRTDLADQSQSAYDLALATVAGLRGWSDQEIANLIIAARRKHNEKPEKALRMDYVRRTLARVRESTPPQDDVPVDISRIAPQEKTKAAPPRITDPGPIPESMLRIPGFISEVMDYTLATAPYPQVELAFTGALSLQATLAGRKVKDSLENRTTLYVVTLAKSGTGKEHPRKVNQRILVAAGMPDGFGDTFASGEGVEDRMHITNTVLFQTDEINDLMAAIRDNKETRYQTIANVLLKFYSSCNGIYSLRVKAGKEHRTIDQPNLCIFGTAIPEHYYDSLSPKMLTNGLFARVIIVEAGKRGSGQEPPYLDLPERIAATAKWWADFRPGSEHGNLNNWHPKPRLVDMTPDALAAMRAARLEADAEYAKAESNNDTATMSIWARAYEKARRLALIYACSENHLDPMISRQAAEWAWAFAKHQTQRMVFGAHNRVAENPFHAECLKVMEKLRAEPGKTLKHSVLMKRMKLDAQMFQKVVETLYQQEDIQIRNDPTKGRAGTYYLLREG